GRSHVRGDGLSELGPPDLAAGWTHGGIVRHVLGFERCDTQPASSEQATQSGDERALADGRGGALNHEYRRQVAVTHANRPMISIRRWHSAGNRQAMRMLLGRPKDAQSRTTRPWGNSARRKLAPSLTSTRTKFAWDGW